MSCGGLDLLAGSHSCGGSPGLNTHESYKGSESSGPALNYSSLTRYQGQETPLPQTAMSRSYSTERIYLPSSTEAQPLERIYESKPLEIKLGEASEVADSSDRSTQPAIDSITGQSIRRIYEQSIGELVQMEDTYAKTRLLERRIGEALMEQPQVLNPLVN